MPHKHIVFDNDKLFVVDAITRAITTESKELSLMQGDHNSEIYTFEIPKLVEGHDMSLCNRVEIHYNNVSSDKVYKNEDIYYVPDLRVSETDPEKLTFSWLISGNATKYAGALAFRVRFCCIDEKGKYTYKWHTDIFKGVTVSDGLDNTAILEEDFSDAFTEWEARLDEVDKALTEFEQGTIKTVDVVDLSTCESGIYLSNTIIYHKPFLSQPFREMIPERAILIVLKDEWGIYFQWMGASYTLQGRSNADGEFENGFAKYDFTDFASTYALDTFKSSLQTEIQDMKVEMIDHINEQLGVIENGSY